MFSLPTLQLLLYLHYCCLLTEIKKELEQKINNRKVILRMSYKIIDKFMFYFEPILTTCIVLLLYRLASSIHM